MSFVSDHTAAAGNESAVIPQTGEKTPGCDYYTFARGVPRESDNMSRAFARRLQRRVGSVCE